MLVFEHIPKQVLRYCTSSDGKNHLGATQTKGQLSMENSKMVWLNCPGLSQPVFRLNLPKWMDAWLSYGSGPRQASAFYFRYVTHMYWHYITIYICYLLCLFLISWFFKVTFSTITSRSLNPKKGHLTTSNGSLWRTWMLNIYFVELQFTQST